MGIYQNKYRIESIRLKGWDYTNPWWYYVTINTKNHYPWFGSISKSKMILNELGEIIASEWEKTRIVRKNVEMDYYVIMPNHIHGIIIIDHKLTSSEKNISNRADSNNPVEKEIITNTNPKKFQSNSLGSIIGQIKSVCTKQIYLRGHIDFAWQAGYYDRIIRNENELYKIRRYIEQNPLRWGIEKDLPENLEI
jgi:putative transposase